MIGTDASPTHHRSTAVTNTPLNAEVGTMHSLHSDPAFLSEHCSVPLDSDPALLSEHCSAHGEQAGEPDQQQDVVGIGLAQANTSRRYQKGDGAHANSSGKY